MTTTNRTMLAASSGWILIVGGVLMIAFMLHHPTAGGADTRETLARLEAMATLNATVHGTLIGLMVALVYAISGLVSRLGVKQALPRAGLVFFGFGIVGYCLAAVVSGFVQPGIAMSFLDADNTALGQVQALMRLNWEMNQAFANAGAVGTGLGITLISAALGRHTGALRWVGLLGLGAGLAPAILLVTGHLALHLHGMLAVAVAQSLWYVACGCLLLWGPLRRA